MKLRPWMLRVLRVVFVAALAWVGYRLLAPEGYGWVVPAVAAIVVAIWIAFRYVAIRRANADVARTDRWAEALLDPPRRPEAIREISARMPAAKDPSEHARLALVLAELLEADGEPKKAIAAIDAVPRRGLPVRARAMLAHAKAVASISAGDLDLARAALDDAPVPCGDPAIDARVELLSAVILAERGEGERALELAEKMRNASHHDADVRIEARVLKAVALDVLGDRDDALKVMRALGREMLEVLSVLGLPRVRELSQAALGEDE
jgi:hypothetical protein